MFSLRNEYGGLRRGLIESTNKSAETPCFFMTSNFGGGGTNVSRLLVYSDIFINTNEQLLLNYYYLDINTDLQPRFDTNLIKELQNYDDITKFIQNIKKTYLTDTPKKAIIDFEYSPEKNWKPIILLDSGSGNILRGKIRRKEINSDNYKQEYKKIIEEYFNFAISKKFDIIIAIDFAGKNTLKANEMSDEDYVSGIIEFSSNDKNFELLKLTLEHIKEHKTEIHVIAPVHGASPKEYKEYIESILEIEKSKGEKFTGFAVGGLGNPNKVDRGTWGIPSNVNGRVKAAMYLIKIVTILREALEKKKDTRPIHVLGAASPYNIIPLISAGCDSFDCHSPWRRASDGNELSKQCVFDDGQLRNYLKDGKTVSFSKILVPLLGHDLNILSNSHEKFLEFTNINEYDFDCNCKVCKNVGMKKIKKLYCGNKEENYYAKILIYLHNALQYDYICQLMRKFIDEKKGLEEFFMSMPNCNFKRDMNNAIFPAKPSNLADF